MIDWLRGLMCQSWPGYEVHRSGELWIFFNHPGIFNEHQNLNTRPFPYFASTRKAATAAGNRTPILGISSTTPQQLSHRSRYCSSYKLWFGVSRAACHCLSIWAAWRRYCLPSTAPLLTGRIATAELVSADDARGSCWNVMCTSSQKENIKLPNTTFSHTTFYENGQRKSIYVLQIKLTDSQWEWQWHLWILEKTFEMFQVSNYLWILILGIRNLDWILCTAII